ncbi:unnamed protein product [Protopolystoma xenopodis]|uniref:Uncharacterized protein n=1 Tax=Protopolystoma xenopodis TaxID=117903 RepID=A0A3S4ZBB8_9PLAT|nr:unnamed protein product [Protopolystoma xenopodis]
MSNGVGKVYFGKMGVENCGVWEKEEEEEEKEEKEEEEVVVVNKEGEKGKRGSGHTRWTSGKRKRLRYEICVSRGTQRRGEYFG